MVLIVSLKTDMLFLVKTISIDYFLECPVGEFEYQGTVLININRQTFGFLQLGNDSDLSL